MIHNVRSYVKLCYTLLLVSLLAGSVVVTTPISKANTPLGTNLAWTWNSINNYFVAQSTYDFWLAILVSTYGANSVGLLNSSVEIVISSHNVTLAQQKYYYVNNTATKLVLGTGSTPHLFYTVPDNVTDYLVIQERGQWMEQDTNGNYYNGTHDYVYNKTVYPYPSTPAPPDMLSASCDNQIITLYWANLPSDQRGTLIPYTQINIDINTTSNGVYQGFNLDYLPTLSHTFLKFWANGSRVYFSIKTYNGYFYSQPSETISLLVVDTPESAPMAPQLNETTQVGGNFLQWNTPADGGEAIIDYAVYRYTDLNPTPVLLNRTTRHSYLDTSYNATEGAYYEVQARNSYGFGNSSNLISLPGPYAVTETTTTTSTTSSTSSPTSVDTSSSQSTTPSSTPQNTLPTTSGSSTAPFTGLWIAMFGLLLIWKQRRNKK